MRKHQSTNGDKHPYFRSDTWANGSFDWLWDKYKHHPKVIERLNHIKTTCQNEKAVTNLIPSNHYPKNPKL